MNAVEARALSKTFYATKKAGWIRRERTEVPAVTGVDLRIAVGEMVGCIGPNGAGKSTTIKMLTGVLQPTSGQLSVLGLTPLADRVQLARRMGVVFGQRSQLWWDLPLTESFSLLRHLHRVSAQDHASTLRWLSELLELGDLLPVAVRHLSLGQRMRAELAAALLHRPELLILDEPTIGLDVVSKFAVREALRTLNVEQGTTVLLTTHDLADIEHLCPRVVIIDHGKVIADGPIEDVVADSRSMRTLVVEFETQQAPLILEDVECTRAEGVQQWLRFDPAHLTVPQVLARVGEQARIRDLRIEEPQIEEVVRQIYLGGR